ncbi:MAG TPA: DUF2330 domain-containing protein [Candidatus Hydrogenedentes bacterium]|nr:DUF2330 domain-containing protein [Candidatus Hydrogenedentota bacterium]
MGNINNVIAKVTVLVFLNILCMCLDSVADGIMIPPLVVNTLPDMPCQRGLIVYRDGVETLVVESSFNGVGKDMAWIIPVPGKPTNISKTSSGIFVTLEMNLQPEIIDTATSVFGIGFVILLLGANIFCNRKSCGIVMLVFMLDAFTLSCIVGTYAVNSMGGNPEPAISGIQVSDAVAIGDYDVQVIDADTPETISKWLQANAFRDIPDTGKPILGDYIAKGWQFIVARLSRESEGLSKPHPLMISFTTSTPVYPMRLTQLAESDLNLDLFVIAEKQADVKRMKTVYSDRFVNDGADSMYPQNFGAHVFSGYLCLPSLVNLMWNNCVVTWLNADFANQQLAEDLYLNFEEPIPLRETVYTANGANYAAAGWALVLMELFLLVGVLMFYGLHTKINKIDWLFTITLITFLGGVVIYVVIIVTLPQPALIKYTNVETYYSTVLNAIEHLQKNPEQLKQMSFKDIKEHFSTTLAHTTNPYTGEAFHFEETSGGVDLFEEESRCMAVVYDVTGSPQKMCIKDAPLPVLIDTLRGHPEKATSLDDRIVKSIKIYREEGIPMIRELIADKNPDIRCIGVHAIVDILAESERSRERYGELNTTQDNALHESLEGVLTDQESTVRMCAIQSLCNANDGVKVSLPIVAQLIDDPEVKIGELAVQMLGRYHKEALPFLLPLLKKTTNKQIRYQTFLTTESIGPDAEEVIPELITILREEAYVESVDQEVDMVEYPAGVPGSEMNYSRSKFIQKGCARIMSRIGEPAIPALISLLQDTTVSGASRIMAIRTIGRMRERGSSAVPALITAYIKGNIRLQTEILTALALVGKKSPEAIQALIEALKSEHTPLRDTAMAALNDINCRKYPFQDSTRWTRRYHDIVHDSSQN